MAALAAAALPIAPRGTARAPDVDGIGALRPTPIMHWLRERGGPADAYHQFEVMRTPAELTEDSAAAVLQACSSGTTCCGCGSASGPDVRPVGAVRAASCPIRVATADTGPGTVQREVHAARDRLAPADGVVVQADWPWAEGVVDESDVRRLAEAWFRMLDALVAHAARPDFHAPPATVTPAAGLTLTGIDQEELDDLVAAFELI